MTNDKQAIATNSAPRPYGLAKGEFVVPDDFDAPLDEQLLRMFEGHSA
jgi:hypothetical protein